MIMNKDFSLNIEWAKLVDNFIAILYILPVPVDIYIYIDFRIREIVE